MKTTVLGSIALVALSIGSNAANAADLPVKAAPPPITPVFTWTGCYVGIWGGYGSGANTDITVAAPAPVGIPAGARIVGPIHVNGPIGGGDIGCRYQWNSWVIGVEGDFGGAAKSGHNNFIPPFGLPTSAALIHEDWLATVRGRLGYVWGNSLFYVTGGGAWSRAKVDVIFIPFSFLPGFQATDSKSLSGWAAGGGWEYAFGNNWSAKVEYIFVDFGTKTFFGGPPFNPVVGAALAVPMREHTARIGINYKLF